jgi:hypothetical protein
MKDFSMALTSAYVHGSCLIIDSEACFGVRKGKRKSVPLYELCIVQSNI